MPGGQQFSTSRQNINGCCLVQILLDFGDCIIAESIDFDEYSLVFFVGPRDDMLTQLLHVSPLLLYGLGQGFPVFADLLELPVAFLEKIVDIGYFLLDLLQLLFQTLF